MPTIQRNVTTTPAYVVTADNMTIETGFIKHCSIFALPTAAYDAGGHAIIAVTRGNHTIDDIESVLASGAFGHLSAVVWSGRIPAEPTITISFFIRTYASIRAQWSIITEIP